MTAHPWTMIQSERTPKLYFSGNRALRKSGSEQRVRELEISRRVGWRYRCYSYAYILRDKAIEADLAVFLSHPEARVLLDSGAFSFLRGSNVAGVTEKKLDEWLHGYSEFYLRIVSRWPGQVDAVATFDYVRHSPTILRVTQRLWKMGVPAMPVYHGDAPVEWLRRYLDAGVSYIGLGKAVQSGGAHLRRTFYDPAFEFASKHGLRLHGFGETGQNAVRYPWYSLDSTSWITTGWNGKILVYRSSHGGPLTFRVGPRVSDGRVSVYHYDPAVKAVWEEEVRSLGYDPELLREDEFERVCYNAAWLIRFVGTRVEDRRAWQTVL